VVADYILCPLTPTIGGEMGMMSMWEWARQLGNRKGFGVLPQMYDLENPVHKRTLRTIQHMVGKKIYPAIPYSSEIAEATDASTPIWLSRKLSGSQVGARYAQVLEKLAGELEIELEFKREG
jgi:cellulose biosynthesis protein BcsQ